MRVILMYLKDFRLKNFILTYSFYINLYVTNTAGFIAKCCVYYKKCQLYYKTQQLF